MRILLYGRNLSDLRDYVANFDFEVVTENPDIIIAYGGDGTLLGAEREYPGIPKCPLRDSRSNPKCQEHSEEKILQLLRDGQLEEQCLTKLEAATSEGEHVCGLNDVLINKQIISSAVRFRLWLDGELYGYNIVGDGLVAATPFGSTGFYRSITHSLFRVGIGIAFNNSTEPLDHLVIDEQTDIQVEITRGPAVMLADNSPERIPLNKGDVVKIHRSNQQATVLGLNIFRCPECLRLRQLNDNPV